MMTGGDSLPVKLGGMMLVYDMAAAAVRVVVSHARRSGWWRHLH